MAFNPAFSVANNVGTDPSIFSLTDSSTGSDPLIAGRTITLTKADGTVFQAVDFPLIIGNIISPQILPKDYAFNVIVTWNDVNGNPLYNSSQQFVFTGYLENFDFNLAQQVAAKPALWNDQDWFADKSKLRDLIDSATQAIVVGSSLFDAQNMLTLAQFLVQNSNYFF